MFLAPKNFLGRTGIIKLNILRSIVQNFAPSGRRSSEKKKKPQQNLSLLPQAIAYGRTNNSNNSGSVSALVTLQEIYTLRHRVYVLCMMCWTTAPTFQVSNFKCISFLILLLFLLDSVLSLAACS